MTRGCREGSSLLVPVSHKAPRISLGFRLSWGIRGFRTDKKSGQREAASLEEALLVSGLENSSLRLTAACFAKDFSDFRGWGM